MNKQSLRVFRKYLCFADILPRDILGEIFKNFNVSPKEKRILKFLNEKVKHSKSARLFRLPNTKYVKLVVSRCRNDQYQPIITNFSNTSNHEPSKSFNHELSKSFSNNPGKILFYKKGLKITLKYNSVFKTYSTYEQVHEYGYYIEEMDYHVDDRISLLASDIYYFVATNLLEYNDDIFTLHDKNHEKFCWKEDLDAIEQFKI
jgi:hypothetical protein